MKCLVCGAKAQGGEETCDITCRRAQRNGVTRSVQLTADIKMANIMARHDAALRQQMERQRWISEEEKFYNQPYLMLA